MLETFLLGGAGVLILAVFVWLVSLWRRDAGIVDVFWGLGFVVLVWFYLGRGGSPAPHQLLHATLVTLWGVRLSGHIFRRNRGRGEDYRYAAMRAHHGPRFWWVSLFTVFGLQAALIALLSTPLLVVQLAPGDGAWSVWHLLGLALWLIGFSCEAVADWQLYGFQRRPENRGRVLDRGLWRISRHPNYFGEAVLWWGYGAFALASPGGLWTLGSPLIMTILLLRVSGVALLEKTIATRRPEYREYVERTSAFVPWFPKRSQTPAVAEGSGR